MSLRASLQPLRPVCWTASWCWLRIQDFMSFVEVRFFVIFQRISPQVMVAVKVRPVRC